MATLFNTKIKDTYQSLLKLEDNTILTTTTKNVTDGLGNASPLFMSTTQVRIGSTSGSAMYWDNVNNRLGVGTSTPTNAITINGSTTPTFGINLIDGVNDRGRLWVGNGGTYLSGYNNGLFLGTYANTTSIKIDYLGNVGVGTTSQTARLHVQGTGSTSATTSLLVQNSLGSEALKVRDDRRTLLSGGLEVSDGTYTGFISNGIYNAFGYITSPQQDVVLRVSFGAGTSVSTLLKIDNTQNPFAAGATTKPLVILGNSSQTANLIELQNSSGTALSVFTANGSLGIGTSSPTNPLDVAFSPGRLISFKARTGYADYGQIVFSSVTTAEIISSGAIGLGPSDTNKSLYLGNGLTSKITTPGSTKYDGFGNQTPSTLAGSGNQPVLFTSSIGDSNIDGFIFENTSTGSRNLFKLIQNNTTLLTVNPNGNTLIGTTTDSGYKLDVNGTAIIRNRLFLTGGDFVISGTDAVQKGIYRLPGNGNGLIFSENMQAGQTPFQFSSPFSTPGTKPFTEASGRSILNINIGLGNPNTDNLSASVLLLDGAHNVTSFSGTTIRGIYYNPTITSLTGVVAHRAIETTSGNVIFNGGNVGVGEASPTARLQVKGSGSTSATTSLLVQNSSSTRSLEITDDGNAFIGGNTLQFSNSGNCKIINNFGIMQLDNNGTAGVSLSFTNGAWGSSSTACFGVQGTGAVASAQVEIKSTTRGFLPPRMTTAQKTAIASPAEGLMVYDSTLKRPCFFDGTSWVTM
jgi:hypothetical protein